jgi:hypothetical protein
MGSFGTSRSKTPRIQHENYGAVIALRVARFKKGELPGSRPYADSGGSRRSLCCCLGAGVIMGVTYLMI